MHRTGEQWRSHSFVGSSLDGGLTLTEARGRQAHVWTQRLDGFECLDGVAVFPSGQMHDADVVESLRAIAACVEGPARRAEVARHSKRQCQVVTGRGEVGID